MSNRNIVIKRDHFSRVAPGESYNLSDYYYFNQKTLDRLFNGRERMTLTDIVNSALDPKSGFEPCELALLLELFDEKMKIVPGLCDYCFNNLSFSGYEHWDKNPRNKYIWTFRLILGLGNKDITSNIQKISLWLNQ